MEDKVETIIVLDSWHILGRIHGVCKALLLDSACGVVSINRSLSHLVEKDNGLPGPRS